MQFLLVSGSAFCQGPNCSQGRDCQPIDDVLRWLVINGNIQNEFDKYIFNKYSPEPGKMTLTDK